MLDKKYTPTPFTTMRLVSCFLIVGSLLSMSSCKSDADKGQVNISTLGDDTTKTAEKPEPSMAKSVNDTTHCGLDISSYQGGLVKLLASGQKIQFIFCKATQGVTYVDPDFRTNWRTIPQKGFIRGAYHFYMCADDPIAQAQHFASQISDIQAGDMAPVLDIEQGCMTPTTNATKMQSDILIFLKELEKLTGRRPMLYTDFAFANQYLKETALQAYDLWLAEYSGTAQPRVPTLWKNKGYKIWQRSDNYSIDSEQTDFDVFYGPLSDLVK